MLEYTLLDDGTMDTVVECYCPDCERTWEERISGEYAAYCRDNKTGELDLYRFADDLNEMICCECECEE